MQIANTPLYPPTPLSPLSGGQGAGVYAAKPRQWKWDYSGYSANAIAPQPMRAPAAPEGCEVKSSAPA